MRILVTGIYGFVGSNFARMAINLEHEVVGFSRLSNMKNKSRINSIVENPNFTMIYGDITNPNDTSDLCERIDAVVNCVSKSGTNSKSLIDTNIIGTFNLLESACKYNTKFIQVNTDQVYGDPKTSHEEPYDELQALNPYNECTATKAAAEMLCLSYYNLYGLPIIITRAENNYGPYQQQNENIPQWTKDALKNVNIKTFETVTQPWLHIQDHCYAIFHLIKKGIPGEIYNIAGNERYKDIDIINQIIKITQSKSKIHILSDVCNIVSTIKPEYSINSEKLRILGWKTKYSIDTDLKKVVEWYKLNEWWWFK